MAIRRLITFIQMVDGNITSSIASEWISFFISAAMLAGIARIEPLFLTMKQSSRTQFKSEEKYRVLFESSNDAIYISSKDGCFTDVNQAALTLFGYSRDEMIGMNVSNIFAFPDDRNKFQKFSTQQSIKNYPQILQKKNGTFIDCLVTSTLLYTKEGNIDGYQGIIRDMSENNRLINSLESERLKFYSILDELPAFVNFRTLDYRIVFANMKFREMFGDPGGRPCYEVFHKRSEPCAPCRSKCLFENGNHLEFEWLNLNGRIYKKYQHRFVIKDGTNMIMEIGIDITDQRHFEEERKQLVAAIEQSAEGILIIDGKEKILYANPAFEHISGTHRSDFLGHPLNLIDCDYHDASFHSGIQRCLSSGQFWHSRLVGLKDKKPEIEIEASISPVRNQNGEIINCVVTERDITNEVRLERQLRQAQKMEALGTLSGGIAHDFNNILTILYGYVDLALLDNSIGQNAKKRFEDIRKVSTRGKELVDQILAFSRQGENQRRPLQIGPIVEETMKLLRASIPSSIEIHFVQSSESIVLADPTQIRQVTLNLCTNSVHAMGERSGALEMCIADVEIDEEFAARYPATTIYPGPHVRFSVSDTGCGMDQSTINRIFDPYFTTKRPGEGTGLGLSVVHGIVESHGGLITVYSEPGKGTTFYIFLPVFQNIDLHKTEPVQQQPMLPSGGNESILFVDDEPDLAYVSHNILESHGYKVTIRTSSLEALEAFRAKPDRYDLVITDLTMPKMGGIELASHLHQIKPNLPIILCSGFSDILIKERVKSEKISRVISKPIIMSDLARAIREILDEKNM